MAYIVKKEYFWCLHRMHYGLSVPLDPFSMGIFNLRYCVYGMPFF